VEFDVSIRISLAKLQASLELQAVHSRSAVEELPELLIVFCFENNLSLVPEKVQKGSCVKNAASKGESHNPNRKNPIHGNPGVLWHAKGSFQQQEVVC
jgi:hypothetical protein